MARRRPANQPALDLGEAFEPPKPKVKKLSRAEQHRQHVLAGLCPWSTDDGLCPASADARPVIGAEKALGCDQDDEEHDFVGIGDLLCKPHAADVAEAWWWEMWDDPAWPGWMTDCQGTLWWKPAVWVELEPVLYVEISASVS